MSEKPQFCRGCSHLPEGVEAEATDAEVVTSGELRRFRFAHDRLGGGSAFAEDLAAQTPVRVHATVTKSAKRGTDEGDVAAMLVQSEGRSPREVLDAIGSCSGPKRTMVDKVLGRRGTCPAAKRV